MVSFQEKNDTFKKQNKGVLVNLVQSKIRWGGLKFFFKIKDYILLEGEIIRNYQINIDIFSNMFSSKTFWLFIGHLFETNEQENELTVKIAF